MRHGAAQFKCLRSSGMSTKFKKGHEMFGLGLVECTCCKCGTRFAMSEDTHRIAIARREKFTFYCPHGHDQHFVTGKTELEKVREERDRLRQLVAARDDEVEHQKRRVSAAHGQVTRLKNRARAGVCPCCTRTFTNLQRHMATKHPEFDPQHVEDAAGAA